LGEVRASFTAYSVFKKLGDLDVHNLVLVSDALSVLLLPAARGTHQDNSLGSAGSLGMLEFQDTVHDLLGDILKRIVGINHSDGALVDLFNSTNIKLVFSKSSLSKSEDLSVGLLELLNLSLEILDHLSISFVQHNQLVRNDSHLKKGESLALSPGEAFNNIIALLLLFLFDDSLHNLNDDVVVHVGVSLSSFSNQFTGLSLLDNLRFDRVAQVDTLGDWPLFDGVQLLYHAERDFFGVGSRRSNNNISLGYTCETETVIIQIHKD
jgi:hypothetical protein